MLSLVARVVVYDCGGSVPPQTRVFTASAVTYDRGAGVTLLTDSLSISELGWSVMGDIFSVTISNVVGSDYVFLGDVSMNFTPFVSYVATAPDVWGDVTTGGNWSDDAAYNSMLGLTGFTDENAKFQAWMVGWTIILDVQKPSFLTVYAVPDETHIEVRGDATGLGAGGGTYRVIALPGVDPTTGALSKPASVLSKRADNRGCMWLWSGFAQRTHTSNAPRCKGSYVPLQAGHDVSGTTYGAQGGINKLGSYYCWNRTYDVFMGRWTTADPAASPWGNLWSYVNGAPLRAIDASGLEPSITSVNYENTVSLILEMLRSGMFEKAAAAGLGSALAVKALDEAVTRYLREKGGGGTAVAEPPPAPAPIAKPIPRPTPVPTPKPEAGPRPAPAPKPDPLPAPLPDSSGEGGCPPPVPPPGGPGDPPRLTQIDANRFMTSTRFWVAKVATKPQQRRSALQMLLVLRQKLLSGSYTLN